MFPAADPANAIQLLPGALLNLRVIDPHGTPTCVVSEIDRSTGNQTVISSFGCPALDYGAAMACRTDQIAVGVDGSIYDVESTVRNVAYVGISAGSVAITSNRNYIAVGDGDLRLLDRTTGLVLKRVDFKKGTYNHGDIFDIADLTTSGLGEVFALAQRVCNGTLENVILRLDQTTLAQTVVAQQGYCNPTCRGAGVFGVGGSLAIDAAGVFLLQGHTEYLTRIDRPVGYQGTVPVDDIFGPDVVVDSDGAILRSTPSAVYRVDVATGAETVLSQPGGALCLAGASGTTPVAPPTTTSTTTTTTIPPNLRPGSAGYVRKISSRDGGFNEPCENLAWFGIALAALDDLDGDAVPDLAVGMPLRGTVFVLFLHRDGTVKTTRKITDTARGLGGTEDHDSFGSAVASVGDIDGDGILDLAVGAPADDTGGDSSDANRGSVSILFMARDGTVKGHQKIAAGTGQLQGSPENGDRFGTSVTGIGDLNGDGTPDIAVGADGYGIGPFRAGAVWILFLRADGTVLAERKLSRASGSFGGPIATGYWIGVAVSTIGDLDGDGVADLAVGQRRDGLTVDSPGAVWLLFLNRDGTVKAERKISSPPTDQFGTALTPVADVDGDGIRDLVVGARGDLDGSVCFPCRIGAVWVLFMQRDGSVRAMQKISAEEGNFHGKLASFDFFGTAVADLGDIDGDGLAELAVGSPGDDNDNNRADDGWDIGAVWLLSLVGRNSQVGTTTTTTSTLAGMTSTTSSTSPPVCAASCDDGEPCTVDTCRAGACAHDPLPGATGISCRLGSLTTNPACTQADLPLLNSLGPIVAKVRAKIDAAGSASAKKRKKLATAAQRILKKKALKKVQKAATRKTASATCTRALVETIGALQQQIAAL